MLYAEVKAVSVNTSCIYPDRNAKLYTNTNTHPGLFKKKRRLKKRVSILLFSPSSHHLRLGHQVSLAAPQLRKECLINGRKLRDQMIIYQNEICTQALICTQTHRYILPLTHTLGRYLSVHTQQGQRDHRNSKSSPLTHSRER